ncbi:MULTISPECIES: hypothetical protein [Enterobacteriaceae]|uniref:hypothetical protein n=1 Tax=Enterobacteriaceae TaxID=543 RepID=UPI0015DCAFA6|nr:MULTISPECIES: hypothetical protein [unclassified Klebsiella]HAT3955141.1 hypothetical protein [Kluyvera ascorbata]BBR59634.1 hypothetical protein WP4W18E05_30020 [Klebsiella sp. WP4-W18-ESBL-05]BBS91028.1 hypothetical protein WP7S18C02_16430 [Klebsiella sp. WP7-S18-CRE-02]BBS96051.1 hypothetical protein WP7S18C03_16440 [Klebsiella sp. WP7-S18-CRE-03]BBT01081.1 hypothetical protein WP7S18E04_16430 [Klebsiella sp. WP7-S18-ESBL-04]
MRFAQIGVQRAEVLRKIAVANKKDWIMKRKGLRKDKHASTLNVLFTLMLGLFFVGVGLFQTLWAIDDWYFRPDYITDDTGSVFAGSLFIGLIIIIFVASSYIPDECAGERFAKWAVLFCLGMAPLWSIGVCVLRYQTIAQYKTPQFGVCYSRSRGHRTYMYVKNSDWCQHFGRTVLTPSPTVVRSD